MTLWKIVPDDSVCTVRSDRASAMLPSVALLQVLHNDALTWDKVGHKVAFTEFRT